MKCEWAEHHDKTYCLTVVMESRRDMARFKECFDQFAALFPEEAAPEQPPVSGAVE